MAAKLPPITSRALALAAVVLTALASGAALRADQAAAAASGPSAFAAEASKLHDRLQVIASRTPPGKYPIGTGLDGELRFAEGWTSGFWAGALWRDVDLNSTPASIARARAATTDHFGFEQTRTHDLGFMYGESSVAAFKRLCRSTVSDDCARFRNSGLLAAYSLTKMARTTGQGIIPLGARTCSDCRPGGAETIVDSMMNLPLLYWASEQTGNPKYNNLAKKHADWVAKNLQRADGSTFQSASYPRRAKAPRLVKHTHQGLARDSTWSRGQAWSIYGFADAGLQFRSKKYLQIAERNAQYVVDHLPRHKVPLWDYDAIGGAPLDVSAGVITAAGMFHLAQACGKLPGSCRRSAFWVATARAILGDSLSHIRTIDPIGILGDQTLTLIGREAWDDDGELILGLDYALEAIKLSRATYK
ncbi:MAG: hypothetical protein ACSLFF_04400 [Solirubrobacterales bacterium]